MGNKARFSGSFLRVGVGVVLGVFAFGFFFGGLGVVGSSDCPVVLGLFIRDGVLVAAFDSFALGFLRDRFAACAAVVLGRFGGGFILVAFYGAVVFGGLGGCIVGSAAGHPVAFGFLGVGFALYRTIVLGCLGGGFILVAADRAVVLRGFGGGFVFITSHRAIVLGFVLDGCIRFAACAAIVLGGAIVGYAALDALAIINVCFAYRFGDVRDGPAFGAKPAGLAGGGHGRHLHGFDTMAYGALDVGDFDAPVDYAVVDDRDVGDVGSLVDDGHVAADEMLADARFGDVSRFDEDESIRRDVAIDVDGIDAIGDDDGWEEGAPNPCNRPLHARRPMRGPRWCREPRPSRCCGLRTSGHSDR